MKKIKWIIRGIIISPFVFGIPTAYKMFTLDLAHKNELMTPFETIVAIPGFAGLIIVFLALCFFIVFAIDYFIHWVFKS